MLERTISDSFGGGGDVLPQLAVQAHSFLGTPSHPYKVHALWHPQGTPGGNGHVGTASRSTLTDLFDIQEYAGSENQGAGNVSFAAESATKESGKLTTPRRAVAYFPRLKLASNGTAVCAAA